MSSATSATNSPEKSTPLFHWAMQANWSFLNAQTKEHFSEGKIPTEFTDPAMKYVGQYRVLPIGGSLLKFVFALSNEEGKGLFQCDVTGDLGTKDVKLVCLKRTEAEMRMDVATCIAKIAELATKTLKPKAGQKIGFSLLIESKLVSKLECVEAEMAARRKGEAIIKRMAP